WEGEPLGHHHKVENAAVLAGREIEPGHFLVVDEKRRRFLLVEGRKSPPLTPHLLEPHAPARDLRNWKPRAQLVEKLRRKAHEAGLVIRWTSQYRPAPDAAGTGADCPGYPQGWPGKAAKPSMPTHFPFALFGTNGRISSKIGPKDNAQGGHDDRNQRRSDDPPRRAGERRSRRERSRFGRHASSGADRRAQDLRARARRLARRLVLAARGRPSTKWRAPKGTRAHERGAR